MIRARLIGAAAALGLATLLIGLPALLLATGPLLLPPIGTWDDLGRFLLGPDDGTLALLAVWAAGWIAWAVLACLTGVEVVAIVRGVRPARRPALGWPQRAVRALVTTAALLFVTTPTVTELATTVAAAQTLPERLPSHPSQPQEGTSAEKSTTSYVVKRGDSLWRIAERRLGDGERYPEIVALNARLLHRGPDFLRIGWTLRLPDTPAGQSGYEDYTVQKGDTLSGIAEDELGDARAWPRIAEASRTIVQPDGRQLADPDQIDIGWTLHLPTDTQATDRAPEPVTAPEPVATPEPDSTPRATPSPEPVTTAPATPTRTRDAPTRPTATRAVTAAPATPAATTLTPAPGSAAATAPDEDADAVVPSWMLAGLTGAGAILAGSLWLVLKRYRAIQFRHRRPGRMIAPLHPRLAPVERTLHAVSTGAAEDHVQRIDAVLKDLAQRLVASGRPVPQVAALRFADDGITVRLAEPLAKPPSPWQGEGVVWLLPADRSDRIEPTDLAAPYPLLVTIGSDADDGVWLVNAEQFGVITIDGDPDYAADLARSIAAEIAANPWSADARADCFGIAGEVRPINPAHLRYHDTTEAVRRLAAEVAGQADRLTDAGAVDTPTARATGAGLDLWLGRLLLLTDDNAESASTLTEVIARQPGRTGAAVVIVTGRAVDGSRLHLRLTGDGLLQVPELDLDLVPAGLTPDEAAGCASLIAQAATADDAPIPIDSNAPPGWERLVDQTGAVRSEYTIPRGTAPVLGQPRTTLLPEPTEAYLEAAATTSDDLARLAPELSAALADEAAAADPTLEADLAAWNDPGSTRPRIRVLGPVSADIRATGEPAAVRNRRAHYIELLAYLATRSHGATTEEVADAMGIDPSRVRAKIADLRAWLGKDAETGEDYVPYARSTASFKTAGTASYELNGVLIDANLFRRLRLRGQSRGAAGIEDLRRALALIVGEPLSGFRKGRGGWVYGADRLDQFYVCAIVDVAHIVSTSDLQSGNRLLAREAASVAMTAAPAEETPRLDHAAARGAEPRESSDQHGSPFPDEDDWPDRTREISERCSNTPRATSAGR